MWPKWSSFEHSKDPYKTNTGPKIQFFRFLSFFHFVFSRQTSKIYPNVEINHLQTCVIYILLRENSEVIYCKQ